MQLYIDPNHCIDCEACVPECPVEAIHHDSRIPPAWLDYVELNARRSNELMDNGGHITERQEPKKGPGCCG
jgi:ferredoxin